MESSIKPNLVLKPVYNKISFEEHKNVRKAGVWMLDEIRSGHPRLNPNGAIRSRQLNFGVADR